jgi:hypothetical protein
MDGFLAGIPMALAVVALGFILRKPLFTWLNRYDRVKTGDTTLEVVPQVELQANASKANQISGDGPLSGDSSVVQSTAVASASPATAVTNTNPTRINTLKNFGVSPLIVERETAIREELTGIEESERLSILVRHLAVAQLQWNAEEAYRLIYGSQLSLLQHLNLYGETSEQTLLDLFYASAKEQYPKPYENISTQNYLQYLITAGLIVRTTTGEATSFRITLRGKGLLEWIVARGILAKKPF